MRSPIKPGYGLGILFLLLLQVSACGTGGSYIIPERPMVHPPASSGMDLVLLAGGVEVNSSLELAAGQSLNLELVGTRPGAAVAWSTSNVTVAQVPSPGRLLGVNAGRVTLRVITSGQRMEVPVRVLPSSPDPSVSPPLPDPESPGLPDPEDSADPRPPEPEIPPAVPSDPFFDEVVEFFPGEHAGFGSEDFPQIVLGGPQGKGNNQGGFHVLSLGSGGEIVLKTDSPIYDGPGEDFIIFENAFHIGGNPEAVFAELGEVSVSQDGVNFFTFPCEAEDALGGFPGCAGFTPVLANIQTNDIDPTDPELAGGDSFDLQVLGMTWARYVRIRDLSSSGSGNTAGFDLDAIAIVHPDLGEIEE